MGRKGATSMQCKSVFLVPALGLLASVLVGCGPKTEETPPTTTVVTTAPPATTVTTTTPPGPATPAAPATNDPNATTDENTAATEAVNKAIHTNTQMTGSRITAVVSNGGTARLTGTAQNRQQKALAETAAHKVDGVSSVVNKIEINATGGIKAPKPTPPPTKVIVVPGPPAPAKTPPPSAPGDGSTDTTTTGGDGTGTTTNTTTTTTTTPPPAPPTKP